MYAFTYFFKIHYSDLQVPYAAEAGRQCKHIAATLWYTKE